MAKASRQARILVLYHTNTGNTRLMADLVAEGAAGVPETDVRLRGVDEATADDLLWCDGIAVGSPTCMGTPPWQMKRFGDVTAQTLWPKIEGKFGCAFSSSGGLVDRLDPLAQAPAQGTAQAPAGFAFGLVARPGLVAGPAGTDSAVVERPPRGHVVRDFSWGDPRSRRSGSPTTGGPEAFR